MGLRPGGGDSARARWCSPERRALVAGPRFLSPVRWRRDDFGQRIHSTHHGGFAASGAGMRAGTAAGGPVHAAAARARALRGVHIGRAARGRRRRARGARRVRIGRALRPRRGAASVRRTRVRVQRTWTATADEFVSTTRLSPYPDAALTRLQSGTLEIRWRLARTPGAPLYAPRSD